MGRYYRSKDRRPVSEPLVATGLLVLFLGTLYLGTQLVAAKGQDLGMRDVLFGAGEGELPPAPPMHPTALAKTGSPVELFDTAATPPPDVAPAEPAKAPPVPPTPEANEVPRPAPDPEDIVDLAGDDGFEDPEPAEDETWETRVAAGPTSSAVPSEASVFPVEPLAPQVVAEPTRRVEPVEADAPTEVVEPVEVDARAEVVEPVAPTVSVADAREAPVTPVAPKPLPVANVSVAVQKPLVRAKLKPMPPASVLPAFTPTPRPRVSQRSAPAPEAAAISKPRVVKATPGARPLATPPPRLLREDEMHPLVERRPRFRTAETLQAGKLVGAAGSGLAGLVGQLLDHRIPVDAVDDSGSTALHAAAAAGHHEVVWMLLEYGADPGATDGGGWTPLMHAIGRGHLRSVEHLLDAKSPRDSADSRGVTVARLARSCGVTPIRELVLGY